MIRLRCLTTLFLRIVALLLASFVLAQTAKRTLIRVPVANMFSAPSDDTDVVSQAIYATQEPSNGHKVRARAMPRRELFWL